MPALLIILDPQGRFVWINRPPRVDLIRHSFFDFIPEADQADARAAIERVVRTGQPDRFTGFGLGRRGARSRYENQVAPIKDGDRVVAMALISRDVSEEWE